MNLFKCNTNALGIIYSVRTQNFQKNEHFLPLGTHTEVIFFCYFLLYTPIIFRFCKNQIDQLIVLKSEISKFLKKGRFRFFSIKREGFVK